MDIDSSVGPRAKIDRAKEHLEHFDTLINGYLESNPYRFRLEEDIDGTSHVFLDYQEPIPIRWSVVVGDIIHNARSALDLLITHARFVETGEIEDIRFPIFRNRTDFEERGLKKFRGMRPRSYRFLRLIKPYQRLGDPGNHSNMLVLLNRLSNRDKHNLLVIVGTAPSTVSISPIAGDGESQQFSPQETVILQDGVKIFSGGLSSEGGMAHQQINLSFTTQIRLHGVEGLPAVGASSTLHHIVKIVDRIVGLAERRLYP